MNLTSTLVAAAAVGLFGGLTTACSHETKPAESPSASSAGMGTGDMGDAQAAKHACKGQNACKGQGGCKTDTHACKGQNACKGQGGCKTV